MSAGHCRFVGRPPTANRRQPRADGDFCRNGVAYHWNSDGRHRPLDPAETAEKPCGVGCDVLERSMFWCVMLANYPFAANRFCIATLDLVR
jgi:hypothetical protein